MSEEEAGYEETGHATETDYEELCGKVEELRERKQYMDQLLSYYSVSYRVYINRKIVFLLVIN